MSTENELKMVIDFDSGIYDITQKRLFLYSENKEIQIINDVKRIWIKYHNVNNCYFILVDFDSPNKPQIYVVKSLNFVNPELPIFNGYQE